MMPSESNTEKGLKYFNYGFILYIIALTVFVILLVASIGVISSIIEGTEGEMIKDAEGLFEEGPFESVSAQTSTSNAPNVEIEKSYIVTLVAVDGNYSGIIRFNPEKDGEYLIFLEFNADKLDFTIESNNGIIVDAEKTDEHDSKPFEWHGSFELEEDENYVLRFGPTQEETFKITLLYNDEIAQLEEAMGPLIGMIAGLCIGILLIIIGLILFLVGLVSIYSGRMEFGEAHANSAQNGLIFLIIGVVINFVGGIVPGPGAQAVGIFSGVLVALGIIYLIKEISDEKGRKMLWLGGVLYIVIGIVSAVVTIWLFTSYGLYDLPVESEAASEEVINNALSIALISMGISSLVLIPIILFFLAYRRVYTRIKNRELQPTMPYPPPYPGQYPPPQYPYQPYPPYQPPPYPPSGPPPGEGGPPSEGVIPPGPSAEGAVQPTAVPSDQGITTCPYCGTQIPAGSTICPVCKKNL